VLLMSGTPQVSECRAHRDAIAHPTQSCAGRTRKRCQAQLEPTALSVLAMLLPAVCTFCPWALACS
jgi:hypothetical protein